MDVGIFRPRRVHAFRLAIAALPFVIPPLFCLATRWMDLPDIPMVLLALASLMVFLGASVVTWINGNEPDPTKRKLRGQGTLRIDDQHVSLEPLCSIPRSEIVSGLVVPFSPWARVELQCRDGRVLVADVKSHGTAQQILQFLNLDASSRVAHVRMSQYGKKLSLGCLTSVLTLLAAVVLVALMRPQIANSVAVWILLGAVPIMSVIALIALGESQLVVGRDGITVKQDASRRFVPYSALSNVHETVGNNLQLIYQNGKTELIKTGTLSIGRLRGVVERIRSAMALEQRIQPGSHAEHLARAGRTVSDWRKDLRALLTARGDYRHVDLSPDELAQWVNNQNAALELRLGAAIALAESGDTQQLERVRVAAQACAREPVRVVLEQVAQGDVREEVIEQLLQLELEKER
jgi:hypothetical protein